MSVSLISFHKTSFEALSWKEDGVLDEELFCKNNPTLQ
jgi:hypothetical protein